MTDHERRQMVRRDLTLWTLSVLGLAATFVAGLLQLG